MEIQKELLAPCGLYCGVCAIRIAHRDNNQKFKEKLAPVYGLKPEDIHCNGCLAENDADIFPFCRVCPIKSCTREKGYEGCHQCDEFPCRFIEEFPVPVGKKVILTQVPRWRELGTVEWVRQEEAKYSCPSCGNTLFRGAKRCNRCGLQVDLD